MAKSLVFVVKGSKGAQYMVSASREGDNFTMRCTCRAAEFGLACKHRLNLLQGDVSGLLSDNEDDVNVLRELLAGTDVEQALAQVQQAEEAVEAAKKELKARKKMLGRLLDD